MRYIDGSTFDHEGTWRNIAMIVGHWSLRGYGFWAVEDKATGAFVGRVGLWYPHGWPGIECGWALVRAHWGKGYARESARATLAWSFETLGLEHIISVIYKENERSIRVARAIGERYERDMRFHDRDCAIYCIDRNEFAIGIG